MYEMIILFHPYGTLMAYIMQHGGMAYIMQHGGMAYGPLAHGRRVYNERTRARCIYRTNALWVHEHYTLARNSLARFNLLAPTPLFLRLRIYYRPQVLN